MKNVIILLVGILYLLPLTAQNNFLNFDGSNDFVQVNDHSLLDFGTGDFTVECRVKKLEGSSSWSNTYAIDKWNNGGNAGTNEWAFVLTQNGNNEKPRFSIESGNTKHTADATTSLALNVWYHIAGVREGGEMRIYVDGVLENSSATIGTDAVNNVGRHFRMATNDNCCGNGFSPNSEIELEEVRIWNVARTQAEIQTNMNGTVSPSHSDLVAYYQFNQGVACGDNSGISMLIDSTSNGLNGNFNNFSMSNGCISNFSSESPLPVELVSLEAEKIQESVELSWITTFELETKGFEIQHSTNAKDWEVLDFINASGNSTELLHYEFHDENAHSGYNYYRLKTLDFDGAFEFSKVVLVNFGQPINLRVFPNPIYDELTIEMLETNGEMKWCLVNIYGKKVLSFTTNGNSNLFSIGLPGVSPGHYILQIQATNGNFKAVPIIKMGLNFN